MPNDTLNLDFSQTGKLLAGPSTGLLRMPPSDPPFPAVILLHGFASHQDEVGGFYQRQSERLAAAGVASLRFTFSGFDLPAEVPVPTTLEDMIAQVEAAHDALASVPSIDTGRTGLLGFSLGGAVAVLAAARHPDRFKALVTWSCAAELNARFRDLLSAPLFERALAGEDIFVDLGWRSIRLSAAFVQSLARHRPLEEIRAYPNPFLAIAGSADPLSVYLDDFYSNLPGAVKEKLLLQGADHTFNILEAPAKFAPDVLAASAGWFRRHLFPA